MLSKCVSPLKTFRLFPAFTFATLPVRDLPIREKDPELNELLRDEMKRQYQGIELIASENYAGKAVRECLG
ncbi:MAG: hypothetical protein MJ252_29265, partial [archaeon]|nr:hypothetical protein [archaeon]